MTEIRETLTQAIEWANERLRSEAEPPWSYYRLMQLREAATELVAGMNATMQPTDDSPGSEGRPASASQQGADIVQLDTAPHHRRSGKIPLPT